VTEPLDVAETRTAYDTVAADYADLLRNALAASPLDRALLGVLAERVQLAGDGPVPEPPNERTRQADLLAARA
jgi:hypothetical protein